MAQQHRCIYRDNFSRIRDKDLIDIANITDSKVKKFIIDSNTKYYQYNKTKNPNLHSMTKYLEKNIVGELDNLFAKAYNTQDYTEIEKYIIDNNVQEITGVTILNNKTAIRYFLLETIQNIVLESKYRLRRELLEYYKKVFGYCLQKYTLKFINDFFILP